MYSENEARFELCAYICSGILTLVVCCVEYRKYYLGVEIGTEVELCGLNAAG